MSSGGAAAAPRTVETTVTYLEMTDDPGIRPGPPPVQPLMLLHAVAPPVHFYRYLYHTVGHAYVWVDRKKLSDKALAAEIHAETTTIYVAYVAGCPAGYFELDTSDPDNVEIAYFGIVPEFVGHRLGRWLLASAIRTAWDRSPVRLHVQTCTLDHPRALPLYQRMGFRPFKQAHKVMALPSAARMARA